MAALDPQATTSIRESLHIVGHHTTANPRIVNIGSRKSQLAIVQTEIVRDMLQKAWPENEYRVHAISTMGDKNQVTALHSFGAKSLWTHELEAMLLEGEVDFIVHSLKDIPTQLPPSATIGAITEREDPRDALVLSPRFSPETTLKSLPEGSVIGTSSVRRSAQLARLHPHLKFESVRGNVNTRLAKLDAENSIYSAIILAAAGLLRIDMGHRITRYLQSKAAEDGEKGILHAVGQGALGIEVREGDERVQRMLAPIKCAKTTLECLAERSLMRTLEGGCSVPIGVETEWGTKEEGKVDELTMRAIVVSLAGDQAAEAETTKVVKTEEDADEFGREVARQLVERGADSILDAINLDRGIVEAQGQA